MKNLLITTVGAYNHFSAWIDGERDYDIAIVVYDESAQPKINNITCVYADRFPTFKYRGIKEMLFNEPTLMDYDYYWMPDEDIWATPEMINELFACMDGFGVWLGQPSVLNTNDSFISWECFSHKPDIELIYTSFIEVMCPCFSKDALIRCLPTFDKSQSGWGLDLVWSKIGARENKAILNNVAVKHTRMVGGGNLYDKLKEAKIRPAGEKKRLMLEYGIKNIDIRTWGAV
jgi:hypothetical protein